MPVKVLGVFFGEGILRNQLLEDSATNHTNFQFHALSDYPNYVCFRE